MLCGVTYGPEIPRLLKLDWVSRHDRFRKLPSRTAHSVAARLAPDQLLTGKCTSSKAPEKIYQLRNIVKVKRIRKAAKKAARQTYICQIWKSVRSAVCCNKHKLRGIVVKVATRQTKICWFWAFR